MTQTVTVPGVGDLEFPDGMSQQDMAAAIQRNYPQIHQQGPQTPPPQQPAVPEQPNTWGQAIKNVGEGAAKLATGMGGYVAGNVAGLGALGYDITANAIMHPFSGSTPGAYADPAKVRAQVSNALTYQPSNPNSLSSQIADVPSKVIQGAGQGLAQVTGTKDVPYLGSIMEALPEAAANYGGMKAAVGPTFKTPEGRMPVPEQQLNAPQIQKAPVPTTEELRTAKNALYKAADNANVVIKPASTQKAVEIFRNVAKSENLGELPTEMNKAVKILEKRISDNEPLSLSDADKVRQRINDAIQSTDAADRRMGALVKQQYDAYLDGLSPSDVVSGNSKEGLVLLKQAREINGRMKRSETFDEMTSLAGLKAESNYTQAGHEHALRKQFEGLTSRAIKGNEYLTPEQLAAVRKVAAPGTGANMLRNIGKLDPTRGPMANGLNTVVGGGLGGALGSVLGGATGAGAGFVGGTALLGVGANLANRLSLSGTMGRVASAREALVGRGLPPAPRAAVAQPLSGEIMPREPLALPAPNIISGQRSAPGSMFQREQMGMTPDVERAGMYHPGMARQSVPPPMKALPYLPQEAASSAMVVDKAGRVAPSQADLTGYLQETGQQGLRNVRQPAATPRKGLFDPIDATTDPSVPAAPVRSRAAIQKEIQRLELLAKSLSPEQMKDQMYMQGLSREWSRLQAELKQRASPAASGSAFDNRKN